MNQSNLLRINAKKDKSVKKRLAIITIGGALFILASVMGYFLASYLLGRSHPASPVKIKARIPSLESDFANLVFFINGRGQLHYVSKNGGPVSMMFCDACGGKVHGFATSPSNYRLAVSTDEGVCFYSVLMRKWVKVVGCANSSECDADLAFNRDGNRLVFSLSHVSSGTLSVVDLSEKEIILSKVMKMYSRAVHLNSDDLSILFLGVDYVNKPDRSIYRINFSDFDFDSNVEPIKLISLGHNELKGKFSPDGTKFAYSTYTKDSNKMRFYILDVESRKKQAIGDPKQALEIISWSSDGQSVFLALTETENSGKYLYEYVLSAHKFYYLVDETSSRIFLDS